MPDRSDQGVDRWKVGVGFTILAIGGAFLVPFVDATLDGQSVYLWPNWLFLTPLAACLLGLITIFVGLAPDKAQRIGQGIAATPERVWAFPVGAWHHFFPPPPPTEFRAWSEQKPNGSVRLFVRADPEDRSLPIPLVCQLFRLPGGAVARSGVITDETPHRTATADFPYQFAWPANQVGTFNFWWSTSGPNENILDPDGYSVTLANGLFHYQGPPPPSLEEIRKLP